MQCGASLGKAEFWLSTNPLFSVRLQVLVQCWTRGRVKVSGWTGWEILALVVRQLVRKSLCLLSLFPSLTLFLVFYFHFCFALFFSFQHIEAKIEDFCAAVWHSGCLATCFLFDLALFHSLYYCTALQSPESFCPCF